MIDFGSILGAILGPRIVKNGIKQLSKIKMEKRCEKEGPKVPRPSVAGGFPTWFGAPGGDIEGG